MGDSAALDRLVAWEGSDQAGFSSYADYARRLIRSAVAVEILLRQARTLELDDEATALEATLRRVEEGSFSIAVLGEFKRGKSTLVNGLLGSSALPMDAMPATASITRIAYGREPHAVLLMRDGSRHRILIDDLVHYITKVDAEAEERAASVREAVVLYPTLFCQNNVEIIDTPGLSDEAAMTRLALEVIPRADAAVFVISALAPFSETECSFLKDLLQKVDIGRIFFVVTHIDRLNRPEDVHRVVEVVRRRISDALGALQLGRGDGQPIRLFAVSGYQALAAKENHDSSLFAQSRFGEFERALAQYLARDRGAASLVQVAQLLNDSGGRQLQELQRRSAACAKREADEKTRKETRFCELDAVVSAVEGHLSELEARVEQQVHGISEMVEVAQEELSAVAERQINDLSSRWQLDNREARDAETKLVLNKAVEPLVDELATCLVGAASHWAQQEDAALSSLNDRLDKALADRDAADEGTAELLEDAGPSAEANTALSLVSPDLQELTNLADEFMAAFKPTAGILGEAQGAAGRALSNEKVQESWRTIRGWIENDGRARADAQLEQTRNQIRDRVRLAYLSRTQQHIGELLRTIGFETKAHKAVRDLGTRLAATLARESEYLTKLARWRQVELEIERVWQHARNDNERTRLAEMEVETTRIRAEAAQLSDQLARALLPVTHHQLRQQVAGGLAEGE
jgi:hypothetical protein